MITDGVTVDLKSFIQRSSVRPIEEILMRILHPGAEEGISFFALLLIINNTVKICY